MRKVIMIAVLVLVLPVIAYGADAAKNVYVQSLKATVMSAPSFKAQPVGVAKKGDMLTVQHKKGRWYSVSFGAKSGWVPEMVVGPRPPMKRVSVLTGEEENIGTGARRRASQVTSAAAARGLTDDDRMRVGHKGIVDYDSIEKVEAITVSEAEVAEFEGALK